MAPVRFGRDAGFEIGALCVGEGEGGGVRAFEGRDEGLERGDVRAVFVQCGLQPFDGKLAGG